jgi:ABC-type transport system substrate-binding protein/class 3 adenylate cyclase/streptogramin lyase
VAERLGGTVTFVFTDIEGSTRLLRQLGRKRYGELLAQQQKLVRDGLAANDGEEIDTQGDSFFIAFRSASSAVEAAVAIQHAVAEEEWPDDAQVRVRVGVHSGEASAAGARYVGFSVHRAARIGAVAHGGQVLISSSTRALVEDDLPADVALRDLGLYKLKDVDRPERISQVVAEGLQSAFPPLRGATRVRAPLLRRRSALAAALVGVVAAAVAVPLFAFSSTGSHGPRYDKLEGDSLGAVDLASGRIVASTSLHASPNAVASGAGSIWVALSNSGLVERIDPQTNAVQQTINVPGGPSAIAVGGGFVWVAESLAGTVVQIDPTANGGQRVATIHVGNGPTGIAYGFGAVWVANSIDQTVVRIDPANGHTSKPISVDAGADAVAAGDGAVWVTSQAAGVLSKVDPVARSVTGTTSVGHEPVAVATGPGAVWVANSEDGTVDRIDPATGGLKGVISVEQAPNGVAVEADGNVLVSNELSGTLSEIDPQKSQPVNTVTVGGTPQGVAFEGVTAYVPVQESTRAHRGGTLTLVIPNPVGIYTLPLPKAFDPALGYGAWELMTMTNDGLLGYSRAGGAASYKVVPDLAVALPTVSDGGRTYTFQLRSGIHYSTGALVQPADIRRGIERALIDSHGGPPDSYLGVVVGGNKCLSSATHCDLSRGIVTSAGSSTITFHLARPDADFLYQLALPPYDAVPASTPLKARLPLPATGPYEIVGYQAKGVVRLARNPRFHVWSAAAQPAGYPDRIVERYGYTGPSAVRAVEQGKADITGDGLDQTWPPAVTKSLETRHSSQLYASPLLLTLGLWLNTRLAPFNDVRVRQALNYAVNRNRIVAINGGSISSQVLCQFLPPNTDGYSRYCPYTAHPDATGTYHGPDLAKARQLVAASGTKGQPVTIWFYDIPIGHRNGDYFVSVLRSLGYRTRLKTIPHNGPTWLPNRQAGVQGWGGDYPSANDVFSTAFTCSSFTHVPAGNLNEAEFCNPSIDREIARARALQTSNPSAAAALWRSIDHQVTNDAPWVPMKTFLSTDFLSRRTGNYKYCWLAAENGFSGACLDQLWVH